MKVLSTNKIAYHNYFIEDTFEAGISLQGSEVKSIREGNCNLKDSFVSISGKNEMFIKNMYIKTFEKTTSFIPDDRRERKLLMHKSEIAKIKKKLQDQGITCVPTKIYFNNRNRVKLEIAIAKGKHTYDKKKTLADKDRAREMQRDIKNSSYN